MSGGAAIAGAAAARATTVARAIKASGAIVRVKPADFERIIALQHNSLIVAARGGIFRTKYKYLTSYKGLFFFAKSATPLSLPAGTERM